MPLSQMDTVKKAIKVKLLNIGLLYMLVMWKKFVKSHVQKYKSS